MGTICKTSHKYFETIYKETNGGAEALLNRAINNIIEQQQGQSRGK
ncbi:MAG: hypothetical protein K0R98_2015 [Rickettsiaceae bacterium]|jgi:hypothetical protein|nr:hypothetical protein [Rickettsiaceae bacterium]